MEVSICIIREEPLRAMFRIQGGQGGGESWDPTWTLGVGMMEMGAASSLRSGMSSVMMNKVHSVLVFAVAS